MTLTCRVCKKEKDISELSKDTSQKYGVQKICIICKRIQAKKYIKILAKKRKEYPWILTLDHIQQRCENPNVRSYKNYGGKGIKCLITKEELKFLWFRDKAYLMKQPSIDRKKNDKDYALENCQYIEMLANTIKGSDRKIKQMTMNEEFVNNWDNAKEAAKSLGFDHSTICDAVRGKYKQAYNFKWELL